MYSRFGAIVNHAVRPHRRLGLPDMRLSQEEHTQAGLTDTAAHGLGQFTGKQLFVKKEFRPLGASAVVELFPHGIGTYPDSHGRKLQGLAKHGVPHKKVSVETPFAISGFRDPVIIVGCTSVVEIAVRQGIADTENKHRAEFRVASDSALSGKVRIPVIEFFRVDKGYLVRQDGFNRGVVVVYENSVRLRHRYIPRTRSFRK